MQTLSLMPQLLVPGVPGIRVEVNGQVGVGGAGRWILVCGAAVV